MILSGNTTFNDLSGRPVFRPVPAVEKTDLDRDVAFFNFDGSVFVGDIIAVVDVVPGRTVDHFRKRVFELARMNDAREIPIKNSVAFGKRSFGYIHFSEIVVLRIVHERFSVLASECNAALFYCYDPGIIRDNIMVFCYFPAFNGIIYQHFRFICERPGSDFFRRNESDLVPVQQFAFFNCKAVFVRAERFSVVYFVCAI